uniref:ATP synthase F0 subunit 8 n=1 Tax=Ophidion marginatum TaxID=1459852 RepID=UPI0028D52440|nr:ATP synthase F0 subunit 8 [Ophidion marginatum]WMY90764.1 ATP synthase F0 subunit 8 [Ophidion marginatum]
MPQLQPHPWFMIMICTWAALLIMIPPKILAHTYPNQAVAKDAETPNPSSLMMTWL